MEFVLGIIFAIMAIPVLDSITGVICAFCEVAKNYCAVLINRSNQPSANSSHRTIGFQAPEEEDNSDI